MGKIYTQNGWVNWEYIYNETKAFTMVVGARGTGKTFGLFKYIIQNGIRFLYVRRLKTQLDQCATLEGNPLKSVNSYCGFDVQPKKRKSGVLFVDTAADQTAGYGVALSTFATLRGVDYSDVQCIVFDEAIAMANEHAIKQQFDVFLNMYETVNRNRELQGRQPVKCFLLGNANKLANPYFAGWHFMSTALKMIRGKQCMWRSPDGSRIMLMLVDSPISKRKSETALYKNSSKQFDNMALGNVFETDPTSVNSRPLKQYDHVVSVGEIGIYKHKSKSEIYVSSTINRNKYYNGYGIDLDIWRKQYILFKSLYYSRMIVFESFDVELIFRELTL